MCVIWGIPYLLIRVAVSEMPPVMLVFLRTGIAAVILAPFALRRGGLRRLQGRWIALIAYAGAEVAIPWLLLSSAEQQITSALAGLLVSAVPLVGVIIATSLGNREHLRAASLSGLLLGLFGVALIVGFDLRASNAMALVAMAVVVVGYSLGPAILSRFLDGVPAVTVNGVTLALCCVVYAPFALTQRPYAGIGIEAIAAVLVLAVLCTAIAFILFFALISEVGPVRATVITYINPAVAAILGVAVLHEPLTWAMGAGFALVLAGSVLATRRRPGAAAEPVATAQRPHAEAVGERGAG